MRANQGSTMFITQTMSEAETLCDRIAIMVNGGLCCISETENLKDLVGGYNLKIVLKSFGENSSYQLNYSQSPRNLSQNKLRMMDFSRNSPKMIGENDKLNSKRKSVEFEPVKKNRTIRSEISNRLAN